MKNNEGNRRQTLTIIILIIILICLVMGVGLIYFLNNQSKSSDSSEVATLKYTDTSNTIKEGIYITDVSDIVSEVMPSIVAITSKTLVNSGRFGPNYWGQETYSEGAGSGIIISQTDTEIMILTNNHVIDGASELSVQFIDETSVDATVKGSNESKDIAVISVKLSDLSEDTKNNIKIATLGDSSQLKVGNGVIAIGNALGYGQSVTTGVVSALDREVTIDNYTNKMIQIDAAINGGNSGGALLNSNGEVIGINSAKYSSSSSSSASIEGMGFAIPISDVKELIEELMNGTTTSSSSSGITLGVEGYMVDSGFYITKVTSGSIASQNKLSTGNIITAVDGTTVTSVETISNILKTKQEGDTLVLTILYQTGRGYSQASITIDL